MGQVYGCCAAEKEEVHIDDSVSETSQYLSRSKTIAKSKLFCRSVLGLPAMYMSSETPPPDIALLNEYEKENKIRLTKLTIIRMYKRLSDPHKFEWFLLRSEDKKIKVKYTKQNEQAFSHSYPLVWT